MLEIASSYGDGVVGVEGFGYIFTASCQVSYIYIPKVFVIIQSRILTGSLENMAAPTASFPTTYLGRGLFAMRA